MLSFDTTHALTSHLLAADAAAPHGDWTVPPALLLIQDHPLPGSGDVRQASLVDIPLPADQPLPRVLSEVTEALTTATIVRVLGVDISVLTVALAESSPGLRLIGVGVRYDDLDAAADGLRRIRRVDAVDVDGRTYEVTRRHGETTPAVMVDDHPVPHDVKATHAALAALLTAALAPGPRI